MSIVMIDGCKVPSGTAAAFKKLAAAFRSATGYTLHVRDGLRTYAEQADLYSRWKAGTFSAPSVAPPGMSLHESGRALDIHDSGDSPGVTVAGNARSNWIRSNASRFGFDAEVGYSIGEPWHIEYQGDPYGGGGGGGGSSSSYNPNGYLSSYIKDIQQKLINNGYSVGADGADGVLGANTFNAIKAFQKAQGLTVDGIPGPDTKSKLSSDTTVIQKIQKAVGAVPDNIVGGDTRNRVDAVRKASAWGGVKFPNGVVFTQRVVGTTPDGIWGNNSKIAHDNAVLAIQRAVGATVDGVWGPATDKLVRKYIG